MKLRETEREREEKFLSLDLDIKNRTRSEAIKVYSVANNIQGEHKFFP